MITKQEIDNMTPEELEAFKKRASVGIAKKFMTLFLIKVGTQIILRQIMKRSRGR